MNLTFTTSEGRKELPVNLVGTLGVSIAYWKMERMLGYLSDLNGGRISYDTFCRGVARSCEIVMPAAKDSAVVAMYPLGYDGQSNPEDTTNSYSMYTVFFHVYEPTYSNADRDAAERFHMGMLNTMLDERKYTIRITYASGKVHELHSGVDEAGLELVIKMCDTHILTDSAVRSIEIGSVTGLANYWVRGSKRIVYNNYRVGQSITYMIDDALRALTAPSAE